MSYDDVASAVLFSRRQIGLESRRHERKWPCLCGWSIIARDHYWEKGEVRKQSKAKAKKKNHITEAAKDIGYGVE